MFGPAHYVPVLLTKRGERGGLEDLAPALKPGMTPLFVIAPVDWDFDADQPKKSVDAHHAQTGKDLALCWGCAPAFLDAYYSDDTDTLASGLHPLEHVIEQGNAHGAAFIPTVNADRSGGFRSRVNAINARDRRGVCIRLDTAQWPSAIGVTALNQLLEDCGVTPGEVDLVLDLGDRVAATAVATTAARAELAVLPHTLDWRTVTLVGGGFPKELSGSSGFGKGVSILDRPEWTVYTAVRGSALPRVPTFGDYAISNPDPVVNVNPRFMMISATFRYTVPGQWLIAKGDLFKGRAGSGQGGAAMVRVAAAITSHPLFQGRAHCTADQWLINVAAGGSGAAPEQWRRSGTTHHLTQLLAEIATLVGPSVAPSPPPATP